MSSATTTLSVTSAAAAWDGWIIRRLSPDSNPIEVALLPKSRDEHTLLYAMGTEAANVHLGIPRELASQEIHMAQGGRQGLGKATEREWNAFRDRIHASSIKRHDRGSASLQRRSA
jgi:hypothetical protein